MAQAGGRLTEIHLADGLHRLRAMEWNHVFGAGCRAVRFNVGGKIEAVHLLRRLLAS